ncbi:iron-containing alcohol dehydrogenase domain-containing protein [Ditylenchus destructor]|uniref:hydroxyacid-oxoacid transhydrogenase n=1 Tax=Ditylenchus destructor TaxID=166010 RepID=A0AAD4N2L3_9BILA|nr:iron-containing alcohol dehydrogenase domain-containing protein [Ditylenchus destructor]
MASKWGARGASLAQGLLYRLSQAKHVCPHHDPVGSNSLTLRSGIGSCSAEGHADYAFEMISSTLRFGVGVTAEVGYDVKNMGGKNPVIITDKNVANTVAFKEVASSFSKLGLPCNVFDEVRCEPSVTSMQSAIDYSRAKKFDCFVAVGGGSVIDTAKAAALYTSNPAAEFLDYVQKPFGKALLPEKAMLPLIAVPTTAGTGSETTGMPRNVAIYSGFDVLCHALESYTAKPYTMRTPRPSRPDERPVYQGSNPVSDVWVREALRIIKKYFRRSIFDPEDMEARTAMLMASSFAGMGFGNAGVHLCHGLSYPISSQGKKYVDPDYNKGHPLIPHGLSVVCTAPEDFIFTTPADPKRHMEASQLLGGDLKSTDSTEKIAHTLADQLRGFMQDFNCPNGLSSLGFDRSGVDKLTDAALNSFRSNPIAPRDTDYDSIAAIYENSLNVY